ncbi:MAG: UDP-4-amino-4,6-dideoxy-N-acetyl-beta-L-altrosamine transaminase [Opitutaceae bacterium]
MTGGRNSAPDEEAQPSLPYARQWIDEADIAAVVEVLRSDWLTQGPVLDRFEHALAGVTGARHAVAVSSATAGLHLLALAFDLAPGCGGITSPITFAASANCLLYAGARVAFADVEDETALMTPASLETAMRRLADEGCAPGVVVAVSFGGAVPDLPGLYTLCLRHGWRLVEDAAHSLGAVYRSDGGQFRSASCAHTDAAVLSFHPVKHICAGEGGAVLTNDGALAARLRRLRSHGIERPAPDHLPPGEGGWYYEQLELGFNYRMTEMQAALGNSQLSKLDAFLLRRRELARDYAAMLAHPRLHGVLRAPAFEAGCAYHLYVVRFASAGLRRRAYEWLAAAGIRTQVHYIPVYRHPHYRLHHPCEPLEGAERFYQGCLSLPLYPKMHDADQERVVTALHAFAREVEG